MTMRGVRVALALALGGAVLLASGVLLWLPRGRRGLLHLLRIGTKRRLADHHGVARLVMAPIPDAASSRPTIRPAGIGAVWRPASSRAAFLAHQLVK